MKIPLVLLSGLLSNRVVWQHQIEHLSDIADIHVISPSQNTPKKMVQAILDEAPPKFALVGHSMGGWLCLEVMKVIPSRITKLCLMNTTSRLDSEEKKAIRQKLIHQAENGKFPEIARDLAAHFVFNPLVKNDVEKMFLEVGKDAFIRQESAMLAKSETQSILSQITCPTLVIHAMHDAVFSLAEHQELANQIRGAQLAIVENSGHMSPLEKPEIITALLKSWLVH